MHRNKFKSVRRFETLENRWTMAADSFVDNGVLYIQGTNDDDDIEVSSGPGATDDVFVTIKDRNTQEVLHEQVYSRIDENQGDDDEDDDDDDDDDDDIEINITEIKVEAFDGNDQVHNFSYIPSWIIGGDDDDVLFGGFANDTIEGGEGDDGINGCPGDDDLIGGVGNDTYVFFEFITGGVQGSDLVVEDPSLDEDLLVFTFIPGVNIDLASTAVQIVNPEYLTLQLSSGTGIENVVGTGADDTIRGNSRDNDLSGDWGNDNLYGRGGADRLEGDNGDDDLYGEAGNDTYVFSGSNLGTDEIFEVAKADTDTLDFSNFGPNSLGLGVSVNIEAAYAGTNPLFAVNSAGTQIKLNDVSGNRECDWLVVRRRDRRQSLETTTCLAATRTTTSPAARAMTSSKANKGDDTYHFAGTNLGTDEIIEIANASNDGLRFSGMTHGLTIDLTRTGSRYAVDSADLKLKLANDTAIEKVWGTDYDDIIIGNSRDN